MSSVYHFQYEKVCDFINSGDIKFTKHAKIRMGERDISESIVKNILSYGMHESNRDRWDSTDEKWTFTFRDKIDKRDIRVVVALRATAIRIISVIDRYRDFSITSLPSTSIVSNDLSSKKGKKRKSSSLVGKKPFNPEELSFDDLLRTKTSAHEMFKSSKKYKSISPAREKAVKQKELDISFNELLVQKI